MGPLMTHPVSETPTRTTSHATQPRCAADCFAEAAVLISDLVFAPEGIRRWIVRPTVGTMLPLKRQGTRPRGGDALKLLKTRRPALCVIGMAGY